MTSKIIEVNNEHFEQKIVCGSDFAQEVMNRKAEQEYDQVICICDSFFQNDIVFKNKSECFDSVLFIEPNPKQKNFDVAKSILLHLLDKAASRKTALVGVGGGYIGDVVGFISSVYMRGVDFIQVPTTPMAMCDAIIGKVAIDFSGKKNILGNFYSPCLSVIDGFFLESITLSLYLEAFSEIWKHAIVKNDKEYEALVFEKLENWSKVNVIDQEDFFAIISRSLDIKSSFVKQDIFDIKGAHKALSLGHTFANYFEQEGVTPHGIAVFHGILLAAMLSRKIGSIEEDRYRDLLKKWQSVHDLAPDLFSITKYKKHISLDEAINHFKSDKIDASGKLSFVTISESRGYAIEKDLAEPVIREVLQEYIEHLNFDKIIDNLNN